MELMQRLFGRSEPELPAPAYTNQAVIDRIVREEGGGPGTARTWFREMLIFRDLCARSDKVLSPPVDVNKAWHAFLLHSRDYEAYCKERFGRLIPTGEPDSKAYRRAYEARRRYAGGGAADPMLWAVPSSSDSDGDRSSSGDAGSGLDSAGGSDGGGGGGDPGGGSSCGGGS